MSKQNNFGGVTAVRIEVVFHWRFLSRIWFTDKLGSNREKNLSWLWQSASSGDGVGWAGIIISQCFRTKSPWYIYSIRKGSRLFYCQAWYPKCRSPSSLSLSPWPWVAFDDLVKASLSGMGSWDTNYKFPSGRNLVWNVWSIPSLRYYSEPLSVELLINLYFSIWLPSYSFMTDSSIVSRPVSVEEKQFY